MSEQTEIVKPIKILVVDDEPDVQPLITQRLRNLVKEGICQLEFAQNGVEAIEKIKKDTAIELVMTDINMPEMDGLTLLSKINEVDRYVKSVVITAYSDMQRIRTAMNNGAFDFLTKPLDAQDLKLTLEKSIKEIRFEHQAREARVQYENERQKREQAEQVASLKQEFLANMSHEIRTPMNAILGMTRLCLQLDNMQEQELRYLNGIYKSAENLLVIINDILDFSKIEAGKLELESIPFSLKETLQTVQDTLRFKAEEKSLLLNVILEDSADKVVVGDPVRLNQVLLNLSGNAIKFTEKGAVTIKVSGTETEGDKIALLFEISDTGIGISEEQISKLFSSFSQASSDTTRKYGGTGLGLAISKKLVEMQENGTIGVRSKVGEGTTFFFNITYPVTNDAALVGKNTEEQVVLSNLKILLVEDNAFNQMVAVDTLESAIEGVQIDVAENGLEAVEKVKAFETTPWDTAARKFPYDIVLMDMMMPVMDGLEATRQIRQLSSPLKNIPIIALTANAIKEEVAKCYDAGMYDFVTKPFDTTVLLKKIAAFTN
ncbi:MAG: response regulator [Chitinophagales bacterium]|nr:response regulator [Chitinophagales bacterium]MCO5280229.1 response regulator [Chitinophagales bacterium]OJV25238.1 MAG: hypothetical protein BGO32_04700 [Bacteroidetes bacterium 37-13]HRN93994.1 response regulator [Chitinophagales bacterium]HRP39400.1 response regulator [Chitinophagales bacterium]